MRLFGQNQNQILINGFFQMSIAPVPCYLPLISTELATFVRRLCTPPDLYSALLFSLVSISW